MQANERSGILNFINDFVVFRIALVILCFSLLSASAQYQYPPTKTTDNTEIYWGTVIKDPYRWIEDLNDSLVLNWLEAQNAFTNVQLAKLASQELLMKELQDLDKIKATKIEHVAKAGGRYFYQKSLPAEPSIKLYYRQGENGKEELLFDPQNFSEEKSVDYTPRVSDDGSKVLLIITESGGDLGDIHVLDVATKNFLPDIIPHARGRFAGGSNTDIVYLEYASNDPHNKSNLINCSFKLHVLGTSLLQDLVLASSAKYPELELQSVERPWVSIYKDSPFMVMETNSGGDIPLYCAPKSELKNEKINWKPLAGVKDEIKEFFVNGTDIYLLTSKGNPKYRILKTSLLKPDLSQAEIIAEGSDEWKISSVEKTKDYLLINFSRNELIFEPRIYSFTTGKTEVVTTSLQGNTKLTVIAAAENEVLLLNSGWTIPFNVYHYDIKKKTINKGLYHIQYNGQFPMLKDLVFEEVEVPSHDGTLVPLSILYNKKMIKKDGSNACVMVGYGAYGASFLADPYFDTQLMPLLRRGFVVVFAHVRGGGEKGNDWHIAGKKTNKPNTWKDYIACTEWLIQNKYTSKEKMTGLAASAGGILIGRAITERPDLYKAIICYVGSLNALRIEFTPSGPTQIAEFGTVKDSLEFKALLEMDAYHQTKNGVHYPAQLITASLKDFRVPAYIPAKFAANMQAANASDNPVWLYVDYEGGHFGSSNQNNAFAALARELSFLLWQTGHPDFQQVK